MKEYIFSTKAFSKVALHAAKYPHCAINGIFLSKKHIDDGSPLELLDCIPLFHLNLSLSPMMEIALQQVLILFGTLLD